MNSPQRKTRSKPLSARRITPPRRALRAHGHWPAPALHGIRACELQERLQDASSTRRQCFIHCDAIAVVRGGLNSATLNLANPEDVRAAHSYHVAVSGYILCRLEAPTGSMANSYVLVLKTVARAILLQNQLSPNPQVMTPSQTRNVEDRASRSCVLTPWSQLTCSLMVAP